MHLLRVFVFFNTRLVPLSPECSAPECPPLSPLWLFLSLLQNFCSDAPTSGRLRRHLFPSGRAPTHSPYFPLDFPPAYSKAALGHLIFSLFPFFGSHASQCFGDSRVSPIPSFRVRMSQEAHSPGSRPPLRFFPIQTLDYYRPFFIARFLFPLSLSDWHTPVGYRSHILPLSFQFTSLSVFLLR